MVRCDSFRDRFEIDRPFVRSAFADGSTRVTVASSHGPIIASPQRSRENPAARVSEGFVGFSRAESVTHSRSDVGFSTYDMHTAANGFAQNFGEVDDGEWEMAPSASGDATSTDWYANVMSNDEAMRAHWHQWGNPAMRSISEKDRIVTGSADADLVRRLAGDRGRVCDDANDGAFRVLSKLGATSSTNPTDSTSPTSSTNSMYSTGSVSAEGDRDVGWKKYIFGDDPKTTARSSPRSSSLPTSPSSSSLSSGAPGDRRSRLSVSVDGGGSGSVGVVSRSKMFFSSVVSRVWTPRSSSLSLSSSSAISSGSTSIARKLVGRAVVDANEIGRPQFPTVRTNSMSADLFGCLITDFTRDVDSATEPDTTTCVGKSRERRTGSGISDDRVARSPQQTFSSSSLSSVGSADSFGSPPIADIPTTERSCSDVTHGDDGHDSCDPCFDGLPTGTPTSTIEIPAGAMETPAETTETPMETIETSTESNGAPMETTETQTQIRTEKTDSTARSAGIISESAVEFVAWLLNACVEECVDSRVVGR